MKKKISFIFEFEKPLWRWWLFKFTLFSFQYTGLRWKSKFNSPRHEQSPNLEIIFLNMKFNWYFGDDQYWEQWLWTHNYHNGDEIKAKETWPWKTMKGVSTWID